jgi:hypothetical protein
MENDHGRTRHRLPDTPLDPARDTATTCRSQVCFRGQTGKYLLSLNFTGCDPELTYAALKFRRAALSCRSFGVLSFLTEARGIRL